ncbi:MAG TPA: hypothetical protein VG650_02780 [Mycobacteriales bacterium]|nr:hypothetical protein [Mycobacteriales bacterium]
MSSVTLTPLFVLGVGIAVDLWVYVDAKRRADSGSPVVFEAGSLVIATPAAWAVGCLILWIWFFPLYLTTRR